MISKMLHALLILLGGLHIAAAQADPKTFWVIGDTGDCDLNGTAEVGAAMQRQQPAATATLIELGDLAYPVATLDRLRACHEPYFAGYARRLAVPGNHDYYDAGAAGFYAIFPQQMPRKEALGGAWHLLMLNSNLRDDYWQNQLKWLERTLRHSQGECLIAAWHHPRWSSGRHGDNPFTAGLWQRLLGQASFTLHGHDHHFEVLPALDADGRETPDGLPSFIAGNGGAKLYPPGKGPARSQRAVYNQWGFMRLELDEQHYRWQAFNTAGEVLDQGEGECRPAGGGNAGR